MKKFLSELRTRVWQTSCSRYNAARRLNSRDFFANLSLALFSGLVIVISFLQRIYVETLGGALDNFLSALSGGLGVLLLVISLVEWNGRSREKANALHQNAEELNGLQIKLAQYQALLADENPLTWEDVDLAREEYESIKATCRDNHDPIDFEYFRLVHRNAAEFLGVDGKRKIGFFRGIWIGLRYWLSSIWYFCSLWLLVFALLARIPWGNG